MKDMTVGSPMKILIYFAVPILLGNLLQLAYTLIDTRIIGVFLGDHALAAVGSTTQLSMLFIGFFIGMANGFSIMTARNFGMKNYEKVRSSFLLSLLMGSGSAVGIAGITLLFLDDILVFINVSGDLICDAREYVRIIIAGMIVTMIYNVFLSSARAIGDSLTPLLTLCVSVGLNIAGDYLMVGVFNTGVWGAAAATVFAQGITLTVCAVYIFRKYSFFRIRKSDLEYIDVSMARGMMASGVSMGLMSSMITIGSLILQTGINGLGNSYIVAQSVARQITNVLMSVFVAVGNAMATYCSQNYGVGDADRVRQGMKAGYWITCSWCIFVLIIVYSAAPLMIQMITGSSDAVMIDAASRYLRIDSVLYVLVAVIFVQRNSLQGVGDKITPLISSGIEMAGKVILTYTLVPLLGYFGVILVEPIVWIVMIVPLIIKVRKWER